MVDLPIIQKTYDLIRWYVPILNRLPRNHKFLLGDRMVVGLYSFLENLLRARYECHKLPRLEGLNPESVSLVGCNAERLADSSRRQSRLAQYPGRTWAPERQKVLLNSPSVLLQKAEQRSDSVLETGAR